MGCLYVLALEVGSLVGLSACGACPGGWSPAQRAPFQGRVGRHGGESVAAGSDSRVPLGAGPPPTRRLRGPTRASRAPTGSVRPSHWERRALPVGPRPCPLGRASGTFKRPLKKRVGARGRGSLAPLGPSRVARRPRRVPLASARRPPRAPTGRPRHNRARATSSGVPSYGISSPRRLHANLQRVGRPLHHHPQRCRAARIRGHALQRGR